jgi:hypothetical protein
VSKVVQVAGNFVGAAIPQRDGYRFVALDVQLDELDGRVWPTLPDLHADVTDAFHEARAARFSAKPDEPD